MAVLEAEFHPLLGDLVLGQLHELCPCSGQGGAEEGYEGGHVLGLLRPHRGSLKLDDTSPSYL